MAIIHPTAENLSAAAEALRRGLAVAVPTETVYGLAASGLDPEAVAKIFAIKQRPFFDPLILHVSPDFDLRLIAKSIPPLARNLMNQFWPGALTLVLPKTNIVPDLVTSGLESVAIRCPSHPVMRELLRITGTPLAAPSANRFGRISPTTAQAVYEELGEAPVYILDGGPCSLGIESTILDCTSERPVLLRPGAVSLDDLRKYAPGIESARITVPSEQAAKAPGQLSSHYAPRIPLYLSGKPLREHGTVSRETAFLCWQQIPENAPEHVRVLAPSGDSREAAARLFQMMRELDGSGSRQIWVDPIPGEGLGLAILDRLTRASSGII